MKNEYLVYTDSIFFKHEITERPPRHVYSMHMHGGYELLYFLGGDATYVIEDRKYKLRPGDLLLVRPFHYHFVQIDSSAAYERYNILIPADGHRVDGIELLGGEVEIVNLAGNALAEGVFKRMDVYRAYCTEEELGAVLPHLLSELLYSVRLFSTASNARGQRLSPLISEALRYINASLSTLVSVKEIADRLFVTESYLFRRFRQELHQTPKRYITSKRLWLARQRILLGEAPGEVCRALGFGDYTTFYRNYRAAFGCAPTEAACGAEAKPFSARRAEEEAF